MGRRLAVLVALGMAGGLVLFYLAGRDPAEGAFPLRCFFREVSGWHCAGCGATRATHALLHFEILEALRMNAFWVLLLPVLLVGAGLGAAEWLWRERYRGPRVRLPRSAAWWLPGLLLAFWILRNVPAWPFTLLAPG